MPPSDAEDPVPQDRCGEVVGGRYRLEAVLGQGGMGWVYRARHVELDEPVVVKLIDPAWAQNTVARARFRREAKALIRLHHPGVVTMHELGEHQGSLFLVMELLDGITLGDRLAQRSDPLSLAFTYSIFRQLGEVLAAVHATGVVHRDVKPDNVMLVGGTGRGPDESARAVLMDFGLARIEALKDVRVSDTGAALGTPAYMSPEQCSGHGLGPASDIYALGVILFEAVAGHRPFNSESVAVLLSHHLFVAAPRLDRAASGEVVPLGLAKLVEDMMTKQPEARPSATDFLHRLEQVKTGHDPATLAAAAVARRLEDTARTRAERGLPKASTLRMEAEPTILASQTDAARPQAWLRGFPAERASSLVASLAVHGVSSFCGVSIDQLGSADYRGELNVVILPGGPTNNAPEIVRELRQHPECAQLPILVVDVHEASLVAELIRAGASDVVLSSLGDDVVMSKIWRLIRRKR